MSEVVDKFIAENKLAVFSKSYCPYCVKAKQLLEGLCGKNMAVMEIENRSDCSAMQDYLLKITGERSVPRVFIDGKSYGGCTDVQKMHSNGTLEPKLKQAGVLVA